MKRRSNDSSRIRCHLEVISLAREFHTHSYGLYRSNTDDFKRQTSYATSHGPGSQKPFIINDNDTPHEEEGTDGLTSSVDDATTKLPAFRYSWGDYMALSYTWGDPSITREIELNGHIMRVTENVEACLRVLRGKAYIQKGWRIWIDALCINQSDIIERASQVKRMNEIYRKAWTPIIWLGNEMEGSDDAMALAKLLSRTYTGDDQVNALTQDLHRDPGKFGVGRWKAIHQLINRRYWSRMWILQEAAMGRRDTPVLCGKQTLPWIDISRTFKLLNQTDEVLNKYMVNELKEVGLEYSLSTWSTFSTVNEIQVLQDAQNIGHQRGNLFRLLHLARTVFATDARDKVYGILEMMEPELFALIEPDYTASVFDVYLDFAWATIRASGSLDVIRHCWWSEPTSTDADSKFPSWLPDWNIEPTLSPLNLSNTNFSASGTTKALVPSITKGLKALPCRGYQIDEFDGLGCLWSKGWDPTTIIQTDGNANPYGSIDAIRDAIWKTLVASRNHNGEPLSQDYSSLLGTPFLKATLPSADNDNNPLWELMDSNILTWCVKCLTNTSELLVCGRPFRDYFWPEIPDGVIIDPVELRDALMQRDHITVRRKFVTTGKGYVGMALENVKKGDGIYVLCGCSVPVVLRPVGEGRFELLGECYIQGVMEGETMGKFEIGNIVLV